MHRYLLDTDICIYVIKNRPDSARHAFNRHSGQLCISSVTEMELLFGAEKSAQKDRNLLIVESFTARLDVLDFDRQSAMHSAEIRASLSRQGTPIGPYDLMIAGHARAKGLVLITNNEREFQRVDGLRVENWL